MIEERLIEKGISRKELENFARLPKHNGKEDIFRTICNREDWSSFRNGFIRSLAEVLAEIGLKDFPELSPEKSGGRANYAGKDRYRLYVAQEVAVKMLGEIGTGKYQQYDRSVTLDKIYEEIKK